MQKKIENLVYQWGVKIFYVGGYGNFDRYAVSSIKTIKKDCNDIQLILESAYLSTLEREKDYIKQTYDTTIYRHAARKKESFANH